MIAGQASNELKKWIFTLKPYYRIELGNKLEKLFISETRIMTTGSKMAVDSFVAQTLYQSGEMIDMIKKNY